MPKAKKNVNRAKKPNIKYFSKFSEKIDNLPLPSHNLLMTGLTLTEIADALGIDKKAAEKRLRKAKVKILTREALYPPDAAERIKEWKPRDRTKKYITLNMGNHTDKKLKLFFKSAKKILKKYINKKKKFEIGLGLSSSEESPEELKKAKNNAFIEIKNLFMESFEKQGKNNLPKEAVLQFLKEASSIGGDEGKELLKLIKEIESSLETPKKLRK